MLKIRKSDDRGLAELDWLRSRHPFSFADYHDSGFMGFGSLRVINEDRIEPSRGFATHAHRDMEIVTYVLEGALEHRDSIGSSGVIRPGDVQRMSAGMGIRHSEFNHSDLQAVHLLQIWIHPEQTGLAPEYEQKAFSDSDKRGVLRLVGSRDGRDGSVVIHQDIDMYAALLSEDGSLSHDLESGRVGWLQVARGEIELGEHRLRAGDGVAIEGPYSMALSGVSRNGDAEFLFFDMQHDG